MSTTSPTALMIRDELIGFARSKVMLVLWVLLPALVVGGYLLISLNDALRAAFTGGESKMTATDFIGVMLSSIAGTAAALMVAVDIVSERQRKVYELFIVRPLRRDVILWAKFIAVCVSVTVACVVSIALGVAVDYAQGSPISGGLAGTAKAMLNIASVIALSAAVGVFFGVISRTILVAVLLILYGGQNLTILPMLPMYLGGLPDSFWVIMLITALLIAGLMALAIRSFRKSEF